MRTVGAQVNKVIGDGVVYAVILIGIMLGLPGGVVPAIQAMWARRGYHVRP